MKDGKNGRQNQESLEEILEARKRSFGSVEVEKRLIEAFEKFTANADDEMLDEAVGDYWEEEFGSAPFIEEMSFQ